MALSISLPLTDGSSANYFVVQRLELSPIAQTLNVTVCGFFSQAAFNNGNSPDYSLVVPFTYAQIGDGITDVTLAQVYALLQTLPQFQGATIV